MSEKRGLEFADPHTPAADEGAARPAHRRRPGGLSVAAGTHRAADTLSTTADAIVGSAQELRRQADRWAARADDLADGLYRAADRLRSSSGGAAAVADDVLQAASRHPRVVLGGAILVGLGAAVFMAGAGTRRDQTA